MNLFGFLFAAFLLGACHEEPAPELIDPMKTARVIDPPSDRSEVDALDENVFAKLVTLPIDADISRWSELSTEDQAAWVIGAASDIEFVNVADRLAANLLAACMEKLRQEVTAPDSKVRDMSLNDALIMCATS